MKYIDPKKQEELDRALGPHPQKLNHQLTVHRADGKSARRRARRKGEVSARQIRNYDKLRRMHAKQNPEEQP